VQSDLKVTPTGIAPPIALTNDFLYFSFDFAHKNLPSFGFVEKRSVLLPTIKDGHSQSRADAPARLTVVRLLKTGRALSLAKNRPPGHARIPAHKRWR